MPVNQVIAYQLGASFFTVSIFTRYKGLTLDISKQNECPEPEPGCDFEAVEEAKEQWKTLKATPESPQVFTIQMEQIAPFGQCFVEAYLPLLPCVTISRRGGRVRVRFAREDSRMREFRIGMTT